MRLNIGDPHQLQGDLFPQVERGVISPTINSVNSILNKKADNDISTWAEVINNIDPDNIIDGISLGEFKYYCTQVIRSKDSPTIIEADFKATDEEELVCSRLTIETEYGRVQVKRFFSSKEAKEPLKTKKKKRGYDIVVDGLEALESYKKFIDPINRITRIVDVEKSLRAPSEALISSGLSIHGITKQDLEPQVIFNDIPLNNHTTYREVSGSINITSATIHLKYNSKEYRVRLGKYEIGKNGIRLYKDDLNKIQIYILDGIEYRNISEVISLQLFQELVSISLDIANNSVYNNNIEKQEREKPEIEVSLDERISHKSGSLLITYVEFKSGEEPKVGNYQEVTNNDTINTSYCISIGENYYRISGIKFKVTISNIDQYNTNEGQLRSIHYLEEESLLLIEKKNEHGNWSQSDAIEISKGHKIVKKILQSWETNAYLQSE